MRAVAFNAFEIKIAYFTAVFKPLATVTLFWIVYITEMFSGYMYIANFMYFVDSVEMVDK